MGTRIRQLLGTLTLACACVVCLDARAADEVRKRIDVPAGDLAAALETLARQAGVELIYQRQQLSGMRTKGAVGNLTAREAVTAILDGTPLSVRTDSSGAMLIGDPRAPSPDVTKPAADRSSAIHLEGILVTALKREQYALDIPLSIAVIGSQDIERRGVVGMEDYLRSIPGVSQVDRGGADNAIIIRGISTSPEFENFASGTTVGTYFGETPITGAGGMGAGGIDVRPVDLERIEVLRGPQGTAYGSSSLGGTMRMLPAVPKLDAFSGRVAGSVSETSGEGGTNTMVQGVLNLPLFRDVFALRLVGYRYEDSGFYRNIAGEHPETIAFAESFGVGDFVRGYVRDDIGRMVSTGGRLAARWKPGADTDVSLTLLTQTIEQDGKPVATLDRFQQAHIPTAPQVRVRGQDGAVGDTELDLASLVANQQLGWATLTAALSRVEGSGVRAEDGSGVVRIPATFYVPGSFRSNTLEVRLASYLQGPFQVLGGVYLEDISEHFLNTTEWVGAPAPSPIYRTNPASVSERTREVEQQALFGELTYDVTNKFTAMAGARYFRYERIEHVIRREGGLFGVPLGGSVPQTLQHEDDDVIYKLNLSYKPDRNTLWYAGWAQGFRLGRPDAGAIPATCDTNGDGIIDGTNLPIEATRQIDSDFTDNYEAGGKFALFDRRVTIDAALYHIKWEGLPIRTLGLGACSYTANAGKAKSEGIEIQLSAYPASGLRIDVGGGYTDAVLAEDAPGLNAKKGARLPGSPKYTANGAVQYDFNVAGRPAYVRVDAVYVGKFYGNLQESPLTEAGGYTKVDMRASAVVSKGLTADFFVRNLTNADEFTWRGLTNASSAFGYRLRPRTIGIQVAYTFG